MTEVFCANRTVRTPSLSEKQKQFIHNYITIDPIYALKQLLSNNIFSWEELETKHFLSQALSNYIDSLLFATRGEALLANRNLQYCFEQDLPSYLKYEIYTENKITTIY